VTTKNIRRKRLIAANAEKGKPVNTKEIGRIKDKMSRKGEWKFKSKKSSASKVEKKGKKGKKEEAA
jgi:phosphomevalonate kinase